MKETSTKAVPQRTGLQIGARLKDARMLAGVRMKELALAVGCPEGMNSKIENGHLVPSLPMLQRLVEALDRDLTSFFGSDPNLPGIIQRARQRPVATIDTIRKGKGVKMRGSFQQHLELTIEGAQYLLHAGDSSPGPREARVLWANTPQVH